LGTAHPLYADAAIAVRVDSAEGRGRLGVGAGARPAETFGVADLDGIVTALVATAQTGSLHTVGLQVGALAAVDALAHDRLTQTVLAGGAVRASRVRATEEPAAIVGAGEPSRTLEVELAGLGHGGAQVLDAKRIGRAVAVGQAGALGFGPAAIPEVAFETRKAVPVDHALRDSGDVTTAVGPIAVASNRAITVGEADPKIVGGTTVRPRIAERIQRTVKITLAGDLDVALHGPRSVDGAAAEEQHQWKERHCA